MALRCATVLALFAILSNSFAEEAKPQMGVEAELEKVKAENAALKRELDRTRKELVETSQVYSRQSERLKRIEMSAAAAVETLEPVYVGSREEEMAESMRLLSEAGAKLAYNTSSLCDDLDASLSGLPMDKVAQAKLRLRLEGLRKGAMDMALLATKPGQPVKFETCRILDVDKSLRTVVLAAGYRDGVRNGLLLSAGAGRSVKLRVVAVRAMVSAAKVVDGDAESLLPGMEAVAGVADK